MVMAHAAAAKKMAQAKTNHHCGLNPPTAIGAKATMTRQTAPATRIPAGVRPPFAMLSTQLPPQGAKKTFPVNRREPVCKSIHDRPEFWDLNV